LKLNGGKLRYINNEEDNYINHYDSSLYLATILTLFVIMEKQYKKVMNIRLDPELKAALEKEAARSGKTMTKLIEEALGKHLKASKS
jgi:predicted HicB family RNase H-like nuclease